MDLSLLSALNAARLARRPVVVVTDLANGQSALHAADACAKAPLAGTMLGEAMAEALRTGRSAVLEEGGRRLFLAVHVPPVRILAVGAVHISQAMVPLCATLGFDLTIVDPRTAFATAERFPNTRLIADWPDVALPPLGIDRYTAFIALTHDPKIDDPALDHALRKDCFYIGALGSRRTHAKRVERLLAQGHGEAAIERIHAPIGLSIGAVSPAEIALSIMAEIVGVLRRRDGT